MATKGSVFALVAPVLAAVLIDSLRRSAAAGVLAAARGAVLRSVAAGIAALVAFGLFEPYAFLRPDVYLKSLRTQADIASGVFDVPFTRVYVGTTPVVYQLEQLVRWGFGPVAGILALAGLALLACNAFRCRSAPALVLVSWVGAYGAVIALSEVKFLRYLEPLAPVFAVAAAVALVRVATAMATPRFRIGAELAMSIGILLTVVWTGAFVSIYAHENPRLAASRWLYASAPAGSILTAEYWDDALPRGISFDLSSPAFGYAVTQLDLYGDLPPPEASDAIFARIRSADYIVQSSQRVAAAIAAAPWRYPVQGRFFDQLERGNLGFAPAATFARPPGLGNLTIDDSGADESFINYDHPRVAIFQRTEAATRETFDAAMAWALQRPWSPQRDPPEPTLLLPGPVGENPSVDDARWSAGATSSTPAALLVWLVLLTVLVAVGAPLARALLPMFPDRGWGVARVSALVVAAYPVWLGASLEWFRFRAAWVIASLLIVGVVAWRLSRRQSWSFPWAATRAGGDSAWVHAEAAFWLVFIVFLSFRLVNPDSWHPIWGGEKAMEFAQINAIGRSAFFPPYDPWYADGYVNYYYYGFYLMAFLFKSVGIPVEVGFNLALPTVMAMLAGAGFSVSAALAKGLTGSPRAMIAGGWAGAITLTLLGNLSAVRGLADLPARFDPFVFWTWNGSRAIENAITEFPYFSGLYADLHAHVIALPLTVAVVALSLATAWSPLPTREMLQDWKKLVRSDWLARLVVTALLLGTLSATNAWDVPVYAALAAASLFMATSGIRPWLRRASAFLVLSLSTAFLAWLLFSPFHSHFVALFGSLALVRDPTDPLQFLMHFGGLIAVGSVGLTTLFIRRTTGESPAFLPWLALAAVTLGALLLSTEYRSVGILLLMTGLVVPPVTSAWGLCGRGERQSRSNSFLSLALLSAGSAFAVATAAAGRPVFALLLLLGCAAAVGWLRLEPVPERFVCLLFAAGALTAAGVELVVVADDLIGSTAYRMNTVFKFYNQVWVLLALSAAALLAFMAAKAFPHSTVVAEDRAVGPEVRWAQVGVVISVLVLTGSLTYPILATGPRLAQRFNPGTQAGTLNALAWMGQGTVPTFSGGESTEIRFDGDLAAIEWLLANVRGTPVIAEASIGPYRCNGSRIANATGLPTIIGWERHEQQQRYPDTLPLARGGRAHPLYIRQSTRKGRDPAQIQRRLRRRRGPGASLSRREQRMHAHGLPGGHRRVRRDARHDARGGVLSRPYDDLQGAPAQCRPELTADP